MDSGASAEIRIDELLSRGASLPEIEEVIERQPLGEEERAVPWPRAWSEHPDRRVFGRSRAEGSDGASTEPLRREFWRPDDRCVAAQTAAVGERLDDQLGGDRATPTFGDRHGQGMNSGTTWPCRTEAHSWSSAPGR